MAAAALGAATLSTPPPAAHADDLSLTFFGYDGSSAVADAVAESIIQGNTLAGALTLAQSLATLTDPQTLVAITDVLTNPPDPFDPETAVTQLLEIPATLASDTVGDSSSGQAVAALSATTQKTSRGRGRKTTVQPALADQYDNGEPKAQNAYRWQHHNSTAVKIWLEETTNSGTYPVGYIVEDYTANTYYGNGRDMYLYDDMRPGSISPTITRYSAKLRQDINNWPDDTIAIYNCPTGGTFFTCNANGYVESGNTDWYYEQVNFRMSEGAAVADVQIQTRRARQNSAGLTFPIAATGG
ncbi:hypothetical protein [Nocardioides ultimimeridianus]